MTKKILMAACLLGTAPLAMADEVKIGVLLGYTGPIETVSPNMALSAELAMSEVSESGAFLGGSTATSVRADSTCIDSAVATAAAEQLVTSDKVAGIVGADCSGVTGAVLQNVARPNGMVMISPSATSPGLSDAEDDGLFFRTAASDSRQGVVMADVIMERGFKSIAITYTNNDYGKGLSDNLKAAFEGMSGEVTLMASHEDGKADYSAEIGALAAAGGEVLAVIGYLDQGGLGMVQAALDTGAFETFAFPDGMTGDSLLENLGDDLNGSFGQSPGTDSAGAARLAELATAANFDATTPFAAETYDATALILLAMQAAGSSSSEDYKAHVLAVANAPGEEILPGELARGLSILAAGNSIDYVGASDVELIGPGEASGNFGEYEIRNGERVIVRYR